jgi:uncharacterized protein
MRLRDHIVQLRDILVQTAEARGARDLRVFGSVARGEEGESSDIDFIVSLAPGRTLMDLARLELDLERLLGRRVDVITEQGLAEPVRSAVLREAFRV